LERAEVKQRFLNQKLGKRMSRKVELQKAKAALSGARKPLRFMKQNPLGRTSQAP
jgi:hypothetical protein